MANEVRTGVDGDQDGVWDVFRTSFGVPEGRKAEWVGALDPGRALIVDGPRGEVAAFSHVRPFDQWFGGRPVRMGGISPVAVAPEHRGAGLGRAVTAAQLAPMRDHGEVISALFPASLALYRSVGWEVAGSYVHRRFPTSDLARISPTRPVDVRRGTPDDLAAVHRCHRAGLVRRDGGVTRSPRWWAHHVPPDLAGTFLYVVDDPQRPGEVAGYAIHRHGAAPAPWDYAVVVYDVRAEDPDVLKALWRVVASSGSQSPHVEVIGPADDDLFLIAPHASADVVRSELRWMLRLVDLPGAIAARGWPARVSAVVELEVTDLHAPWNDGHWTLEVVDGVAAATPGGRGLVTTTIGGLSAWWAGCAPASRLARTGHLAGPADDLAAMDRLVAPAPPVLPDFF